MSHAEAHKTEPVVTHKPEHEQIHTAAPTVQPATVGRILNYVVGAGDLEGDRCVGEIRAAMIVRVVPGKFSGSIKVDRKDIVEGKEVHVSKEVPCTTDGYNVQVFCDGRDTGHRGDDGKGIMWLGSRSITATPLHGQLHWPVKV